MPELEQLIAESRQLLVTGDMKLALEKLSSLLAKNNRDLHKEVLLHQSRLCWITANERSGLATPADSDVQRTRLTSAVFDLLELIPEKLQLAASPPNPAIKPRGPAPGEPTGPVAEAPYDVFLSHNSHDKPAVKEIGQMLQERDLRVWLDAWNLRPGQPWQEELERMLVSIRSAAIFVGASGLGPWETPEMRACIDQFVKRQLPVIPVLLPGTVVKPKLPLFLEQFTWVDLSAGVTKEGLDRIQWGITGQRP